MSDVDVIYLSDHASYCDCDNCREDTCGCGKCCDHCFIDCCANADQILTIAEIAEDLEMELTSCGLVAAEQVNEIITNWAPRHSLETVT